MTKPIEITRILDDALDDEMDRSDGTVGMIVVGYGVGLMLAEGYSFDQIREALSGCLVQAETQLGKAMPTPPEKSLMTAAEFKDRVLGVLTGQRDLYLAHANPALSRAAAADPEYARRMGGYASTLDDAIRNIETIATEDP